jgi:hypothetical protein
MQYSRNPKFWSRLGALEAYPSVNAAVLEISMYEHNEASGGRGRGSGKTFGTK